MRWRHWLTTRRYRACSCVCSSHFPQDLDKASPRIRRAHLSPISRSSLELLALHFHELKHLSMPLMAMRWTAPSSFVRISKCRSYHCIHVRKAAACTENRSLATIAVDLPFRSSVTTYQSCHAWKAANCPRCAIRFKQTLIFSACPCRRTTLVCHPANAPARKRCFIFCKQRSRMPLCRTSLWYRTFHFAQNITFVPKSTPADVFDSQLSRKARRLASSCQARRHEARHFPRQCRQAVA